ncbi:MAG: hypothetical protein LJE68_03805, partial [Rhodobacter sp.]|nr:hypothetical protein [Rhodobacter sp.]
MAVLRMISMLLAIGLAAPLLAQGTRQTSHKPPPQEREQGATCGPHRDSIIMLADRILAERHMAEGFSGHSFGTLAAYLKLRVEDMGARAGLALLDSVGADERRAPRNLPELRLMFAIAKLGVDGGLSVTGDTPVASLASHPFMVPRQVALADGGASFFRLLAAVRADPGLAEAFD